VRVACMPGASSHASRGACHGGEWHGFKKSPLLLVNRLNRSAITAHSRVRRLLSQPHRVPFFHGRSHAVNRIRTCAGNPN
jgi:hypothetical protein